MGKNNKLILPISIILASLIVGTFILSSQILKQNSIAEQKHRQVELEKQMFLEKEQKLVDCLETRVGVINKETLERGSVLIREFDPRYFILDEGQVVLTEQELITLMLLDPENSNAYEKVLNLVSNDKNPKIDCYKEYE